MQWSSIHLFRSKKEKHREAQHIKCQASDMLSLMPVINMCCLHVLVPLGCCMPAVTAFMALAHLVQCLWCSGRSSLTPATLDAMVEDFLSKYGTAFGFQWMTPKFHWMLHLGDHLSKFGFLVNCFCLERRHRVAKRYADELKNISKSTGDSLLMEVSCHHLSILHDTGSCNFEVGLRDARPASKKVKKCSVI